MRYARLIFIALLCLAAPLLAHNVAARDVTRVRRVKARRAGFLIDALSHRRRAHQHRCGNQSEG